MDSFISSLTTTSNMFKSTSNVKQKWLWHYIIHEGRYAVKWRNQTKPEMKRNIQQNLQLFPHMLFRFEILSARIGQVIKLNEVT